jgi:hypothetical protein
MISVAAGLAVSSILDFLIKKRKTQKQRILEFQSSIRRWSHYTPAPGVKAAVT